MKNMQFFCFQQLREMEVIKWKNAFGAAGDEFRA